MRSPNLNISKNTHLNIIIKNTKESPFFLIPSLFYISKHDVNLEIEGISLGFVFAKWSFQLNIRTNSWKKFNASMDLVKANSISQKIQDMYGSSSADAGTILRAFENNKWLKELTSRGIEQSYYGLLVIKEVSNEEQHKKTVNKNSDFNIDTNTPITIEGLD